ncbi:hypothetical protein QSH57_015268 [Fusarium oxysporum f. sp. vasinfectum]|nr:hypothetical protein QSH57_015268 [Fusarium oxysporum f. sp. vasinfectum]
MSYHSRNASGSSHSSLLCLSSPIELDEDHTFSKASLYPLDHTDYEPCRKRIINTSFGARQVIRFINHLETHDPVQHDAAVKRLIEIGVDVDDLEDEVRPKEEVEDGVDIEQTKGSTAKDEDIHTEASSPKSSMTLMELIASYRKAHAEQKRAGRMQNQKKEIEV